MNIAIDLTCLSYHLTGIERYALCITEELIKFDKVNHYILIFRNEIYHELEQYVDDHRVKAVVVFGKQKQLFILFKLPMELYRIDADIFLFLAGRNPLLFKKKGIFCTIHDLVCWDFPETTRLLQRLYSKIANRNAASVSEHIFTVSVFSKNRIYSILNVPLDRITVTYNGISDSLKQECHEKYDDIKKKYGLPDKYILNLSTLEPRKNLSLLLRSFDAVADKVDYDLVLVGRKGWKIDELLKSIKSNGRIHITGFVNDEEVIQIYKNAMCFVFTSLYEGFGIPPLEALFLGTPVLSSNAASLPEVLRNQARYFQSNNLDELIDGLIRLEDDVKTMPRGLDAYQKENFQFNTSAKIILNCLMEFQNANGIGM